MSKTIVFSLLTKVRRDLKNFEKARTDPDDFRCSFDEILHIEKSFQLFVSQFQI